MKRYIIVLLFVLLLTVSGCSNEIEEVNDTCIEGYVEVNEECVSEETESQLLEDELFMHDEVERTYDLYIPGSIPYDAPVVMMLHGFTGTAQGIRTYSKMNDLADEYKFVVVYPQGLPLYVATHWNADLEGTTVDDTLFLQELIVSLQDDYFLSSENTFVTGHSNGGFMSYTLACHTEGVFKAIASYAGLMSGETWQTCDPVERINILQIHGTNDMVVPPDGTMTSAFGFGGAPEIHIMLSFWTEFNETNNLEEYDISDVSHVYEYTSTSNDYIVKYIEIEDQTHDWPHDDDMKEDADEFSDASQYIWEFFSTLID